MVGGCGGGGDGNGESARIFWRPLEERKEGGILEGFKEVHNCVTQSALFLFFSLKKKKVVDMNCLASFFILNEILPYMNPIRLARIFLTCLTWDELRVGK